MSLVRLVTSGQEVRVGVPCCRESSSYLYPQTVLVISGGLKVRNFKFAFPSSKVRFRDGGYCRVKDNSTEK